MIDFWQKTIFSQRFPPKISCEATKKIIFQNCYLLSVICNAKKKHFWKLSTVTLGVDVIDPSL